MSNPALFFDDWENKPLVIPVSNCASMQLNISTINYNTIVDWGDGTKSNYDTTKNVDTISKAVTTLGKAYSFNFTGDIKVYFKGGLKDVYSYRFLNGYIDREGIQQYNIQNLGLFLAQMHNLYSYSFNIDTSGNISRQPTIIGDFAQNPDSVERVLIQVVDVKNRATALVLNFNNFKNTSKLKWFRKELVAGEPLRNSLKFTGDISKIPPMCSYFNIEHPVSVITATSAITYTSGKVWASSFDTLQIPITLTTSELDNLLIDMDNSITTKIGDGIIYLDGYRSSVSDSAVASLQSKNFTVNIKRVLNNVSTLDSSLLRLDFQNNFDVYSNSGLNIVPGGNSNPPTFALSGRKPGEYCAVFNGSQSIKTTTNLPINSDKVTIAFWMKTTQSTTGGIVEMSPNMNNNNTFAVFINNILSNRIDIIDSNISPKRLNEGSSSVNINNGNWFHVVLTIDRSLGVTQNKIYINGSLTYSQYAPSVADMAGNFVNNILYIGQRAGNSLGFNGSLTRLKMYNYPLAPSEVLNLYNSEL